MAEPEIRKGQDTAPGGAEQLPQGEATGLNTVLEQTPGFEDPEVALPPEYAPTDYDPTSSVNFVDERDQVLFADPDEPRPVRFQDQRERRVPTQVVRHLPMIRAMLEDPEAPDSLRAIYRAITDRLDQEIRRG